MLIHMSDKYKVNIPKYDAQHLRLFSIINRLHDAIDHGRGEAVVHGALAELIGYTQSHFKDEESAMDLIGYPSLQLHRMEHVVFQAELIKLKEGRTAGGTDLSDKVMRLLLNWIREHIMGSDKRFARHYLEMSPAVKQIHFEGKNLNV